VPPSPDQPASFLRRHRRLGIYIALLILSHITQLFITTPPPVPSGSTRSNITVTYDSNTTATLSILEWSAPTSAAFGGPAPPPPVLLLHGSPGSAADFARLAPALTPDRRVISVDLLGFSGSSALVPDYSIRANAAAVAALLDQLEISRAHIVGWSNGGGVALHLADASSPANSRIASVTLLASIGVQETEGSGNYYFEHFKYDVAYAVAVVAPEFIPHFGLLGPRDMRHAFTRFFGDSDQRPLRSIMRSTRSPCLILHGRHDFLVPARAAELHHAIIPSSSLVMLDASHFIPFLQPTEAASYLRPFFMRHDDPTASALTTATDLAPVPTSAGLHRHLDAARAHLRAAGFLVHIALIAIVALWSVPIAAVLAVLLVGSLDVDLAVAITAILLALVLRPALACILPRRVTLSPADWHRRVVVSPITDGWRSQFDPTQRTDALAAALATRPHPRLKLSAFLAARLAAACFFAVAAIVPALIARAVLHGRLDQFGTLGFILLVLILRLIVGAAPLLLSQRGRFILRATISRVLHHEWWPAWLFYLPLAPYIIFLGFKHRRVGTVVGCNPGIAKGGGIVGESKAEIAASLRNADRFALPTRLIPACDPAGNQLSPGSRAALAVAAQREHPDAFDFPVVLKPDAGQRGYAFKIARTPADLISYFTSFTRDAVLQKYHSGPHEAGVFWTRDPRTVSHPAVISPATAEPAVAVGAIFSITAKTFPVLRADGRRTIEELIFAHPRFRLQARTFLARFAARASEIPAAGERIPLASAGNHVQGTLFSDGSHLITPALTARINQIAADFSGVVDRAQPNNPNARGGQLDFARFDIRFTSPEDLARGINFAIVEVNGTFAESTNLYDPRRSPLFAYRTLFTQWRTAYTLGAERCKHGAEPIKVLNFIKLLRIYYKDRPGSALSD
jgi:pimeloyl-ACP methyl ester carboxylesterase